jgi:hypothetical protein
MAIVRFVRPWKARSKTTTPGRPGRGARDLDRVLDRLRARVDQQRLRLGVARPELVEAPADLDVRLVHPDHEALVQVAVDLLVDRLDDRVGVVAEVLAGDSAREVEVLPPVGVPDRRPLGTADGHVRRRHASRHVPLAPGADGGRVLELFRRHRRNLRRLEAQALVG